MEPAQIERACQRLILRSIRAFDERDWQTYARLFTPDGVFIRANQPAEPLVGREAIAAALGSRSVRRITRHLCTNIEIEVLDEHRAEGRCYLLLFAGEAQAAAADSGGVPAQPPQRVGEYHDLFSLTAEGWRIARRTGRLVLHAP